MNKIIYLSSQPNHKYFVWQLECQFLNFIDAGIPLGQYHVVVGTLPNVEIIPEFKDLSSRYPQIKWGFVTDTRSTAARSYIPTIKPHLAGNYLEKYPELLKETIFYIDSDVLFKKHIDLTRFLDDEVCYMSNTNSYVNAKYIESKGKGLLERMWGIVKVLTDDIRDINEHSGGAQNILKNLPLEYWRKTELDSLTLYNFMKGTVEEYREVWSKETGKKPEEYVSVQIWCAEMWSTLWNLVFFQKQIQVIPELDFTFATSPISELDKVNILHNAGVTEKDKHHMFFKGEYRDGLSNDLDLSYVSDKYSSSYYASYVKKLLELRKLS